MKCELCDIHLHTDLECVIDVFLGVTYVICTDCFNDMLLEDCYASI